MAERPTSFSDFIASVPEAKGAYLARTPLGVQEWPIELIERGETWSGETATFEARSNDVERTGAVAVRVTYEEPFLNAKRTSQVRYFDGEANIVGSEMRYSFDDVDIAISSTYNSPFVTEGLVNDSNNYGAEINVISKKDETAPPLVALDYGLDDQVQFLVKFPMADYLQALSGALEKRTDGLLGASYSHVYFEWLNLQGAMKGVAKYDDPTRSDFLRYYHWPMQFGPIKTIIPESDYQIGVERAPKADFGAGELTIIRRNMKSDEHWRLDVPEWMGNRALRTDMQSLSFWAFTTKYPIDFTITAPWTEPKTFSTSVKN